ncbi:ATP-binding protein [Pseudorhodoferax sp.]|uniref:ATP-binding protein n=1 Tax=Pseudorhodoferax sp. TaxID=1993553 RepID=UPI002DD68914|nr:ATP-binding protein [Pseudorhodoferax sp.]
MHMTPEQYKTLVTLIASRVPAAVDAQFVKNLTGLVLTAGIPTATTTDAVARWLLDEVMRQPVPQSFMMLVYAVNDQQQGAASLVEMADRLANDPTLWRPLDGARQDWSIDTDPLAVIDGRPFVDRRGFRALLPRFGAPDSPPCVLVTGDSSAGKSYLHEFCRALASGRNGQSIGYARVPSNGLATDTPRVLAEQLALDLELSFDSQPAEHAEPERDAENLAHWITHYLVERPVPALAILDEFGRPGLSDAHHRFVLTLARCQQDDARVRERMRLVLIDYPKERLLEAGIVHEHYVLELIEPHHLAAWFRSRYPGHPEYRYDSTAQRIAERMLQLQPHQRMNQMNNLVRAAAKQF